MTSIERRTGAIVLAAGMSIRMGKPKLVLPWKNTTIIEHIIKILQQADLEEILVITGGSNTLIEKAVNKHQVRTVFNPAYSEGDMLSSVKVGLINLGSQIDAALITLGDQPFLRFEVVKLILDTYQTSESPLLVPSYGMRRGHPWLVSRLLWDDIQKLDPESTLRDFLNANQDEIKYIKVNTASILLDLDTPEDYQKFSQ